jgi:DNA-directed RNA polymerase specialized sigma24 family protein
MKVTESYHDLCEEIDILEVRINDLENEYTFLYNACFNGDRKPIMGLHMITERMREICDKVELYSSILRGKEQTLKAIEQRISRLDSIDYKVTHMRDIRGMTLPEIAVELGYSYDWIKKISARNKRMEECTKSTLTY